MSTKTANARPRTDHGKLEYDEPVERVGYDFGLSRRSFVKVLGAGLLFAAALPALAQRRGGGGGPQVLSARLHLGKDGSITVLAGKVEGGQGARAELTQAAAEELGVPAAQVQMILADTGQVPDDGGTYGSGTSPRTVPLVRRAAAAAKNVLGHHADPATATMQAYNAVYSLLDQQAHLWAFVDNFYLFGLLALAGIPLVFLFKRVQYVKKPAAAAH